MIKNQKIEIAHPKNQLCLFGYDAYFKSFVRLFEKEEMPHCVLLSGSKGLGKSTFIYHFINYLFSKNEKNSYSINDLIINKENLSYKLLHKNIHPNFFLIENNNFEKDVKIEQVRSLLRFLSKSTYSKDLKIVMIDNIENFNLNSANALLKSLEEPRNNTFFFIIHSNKDQILSTIKSRCIEFKIFFSETNKKNIFKKIAQQYDGELESDDLSKDFYFESPGNLIKFLSFFKTLNVDLYTNKLSVISYLIESYKNEKNYEVLNYLFLFVEKFFNDLCLNEPENFNINFFNYIKILKLLNYMKKFNLDEKNSLILIEDILKNEKR